MSVKKQNENLKELLMLALTLGLVIFLGLASPAVAEPRPTASNPLSFIGSLGQMSFNRSGAVLLPASVLQAQARGKVSPIMQLVLQIHMLDGCAKNTIEQVLGRRDSLLAWNEVFQDGICKIQKCFQQAMLLDMLSQMGKASAAAGAEAGPLGNPALASAFGGQNDACDGSGGSGIDPMMLMFLQGKK